MKYLILILITCSWLIACGPASEPETKNLKQSKPNIVYIMADDLGYQELGSYGQKLIKTPNLDQLAAEGMRFTEHYSGSTVCAPSRCTLLTGKHTGHSYVRDNYELGDFTDENEGGQLPLPPNTFTLASMLQDVGYRTGIIGKWGLGGPGSTGVPNKQGFDYFYGYLCQKQAHNYYPTHLWENDRWDSLDNAYFHPHQEFEGDPDDPKDYQKYSGNQYAPDVMIEKALTFIDRNHQQPFFLYLPFTVPHLALQVPGESLDNYAGIFPDEPYLGNRNYLPHKSPRAAYAAMISRMDHHIGVILDKLDSLAISENTLVVFTSDNGTTFDIGGVDRVFFNSLGPLRGYKTTLYEGGIRVPFIVRWPGKVQAGTLTDHLSANWDVLPTIAEIVGTALPKGIDGISLLPTLLQEGEQPEHKFLYWEYHGRWDGAQAIRMDHWKAVRLAVGAEQQGPLELYNLEQDIGEAHDLADQFPEVVEKIKELLKQRTPSHIEDWNFNQRPL